MRFAYLASAVFVLSIAVAAAACPVTLSAKDTSALLAEVPQLNTDLSTCPTAIPSPMNRLVGSGNVQFNILRNDGSTASLLITTAGGQVTGVTVGTGTARWLATIAEPNLDRVLSSSTRGTAITNAWLRGQLVIRANPFFTRLTWFFTRPFVRSAANKAVTQQVAASRPANCDETYMNGWTEYVPNKATWDSYMAQADGICQVKTGSYPDASKCVQSVQLSRGNTPFYLCWYRL